MPAPVERTLKALPVHLRGLGAGLTAEAQPPVADVSLRGSQSATRPSRARRCAGVCRTGRPRRRPVHADRARRRLRRRRRHARRAGDRAGADHQWQALIATPSSVRHRRRARRRRAAIRSIRRRCGAWAPRSCARCRAAPRRRALLVGRDTRESGGWIEAELAHGATGEGATVTSAGVVPTPAIAYLTRTAAYDAGVVISASHNPFEDNGIKVFSGRGEKFTEARRARGGGDRRGSVVDGAGTAPPAGRRARRARRRVPRSSPRRLARAVARSRGFTIALDCANGATTTVGSRAVPEPGPRSDRASAIGPTAATSTSTAARRIPSAWRASSSSAAAGWAWRSTATATARSSSTAAAGSSTATPCC